MILRILLLVLLSASATAREKKGDATYRFHDRNNHILPGKWVSGHSLRFPKFSIRKPQEIRIEVRDLPLAIFPTVGYLDVPKGEAVAHRSDQPWRGVVLTIEYRDLDGRLLGRTETDLAKWDGGSQSGRSSRSRQIRIPLSPWQASNRESRPENLSYNMIITITGGTNQPGDWIRVSEFVKETDEATLEVN